MNKTYEFSQGIIRVVRVVVRDGHPSGKCARVGTDTVRLILEGDSAWIEGDRGRKKIKVLPTQQGDTSLLKARGRQLIVGGIVQDGTRRILKGVEALVAFMEGEGTRNPLISVGDIERAAFFLARNAKVRNNLLSVQEEMKALMSRPDFEYGKDYTELFTQNIPF
jgi:hypothetical protein